MDNYAPRSCPGTAPSRLVIHRHDMRPMLADQHPPLPPASLPPAPPVPPAPPAPHMAVRSVRIQDTDARARIITIPAPTTRSKTGRCDGETSKQERKEAPEEKGPKEKGPPENENTTPNGTNGTNDTNDTNNTPNTPPGLRHLFVAAGRGDRAILAAAVASSMAVAGCKTYFAFVVGETLQNTSGFGAGTDTQQALVRHVATTGIKLAVLGLATAAASGAQLALWVAHGETRARTVRTRLFRALLGKEMDWFDARRGGMASLLTEQDAHVRDLQAATSQLLGFFVADAFVGAACVGVAVSQSWGVSLVMLATVPVAVAVLAVLGRGLATRTTEQRAALNDAAACATASLAGIDVVKVHSAYDAELWQYRQAMARASALYARKAVSACAQMGWAKAWMANLFVVGFWFGLWQAMQGHIGPGRVLTAFYAVLVAFQSVEALGTQWTTVLKGAVAGKALQDMMLESDCDTQTGGLRPERPPRTMTLDDVSFAYPSNPGTRVLTGCSMQFAPDRVTFVVGRSGSGKSTIADLLVQFYRPTTGAVLVDGVPAAMLDRHWLRTHVALVQQASTVFHGTLGWNVALGARGDPDAVDNDAINTACATALLQATVKDLAHGLDTVVGARGATLSGGQRQRLALARAAIRDPAVLVLDETTSGLDPGSAHMVLDAVRAWRRGRTTIVITHDLSQMAAADYVYVMDAGAVVQQGTFGDVAKSGGPMHALLQAASVDAGRDTNTQRTTTTTRHSVYDDDDHQTSLFRRTSLLGAVPYRASLFGSHPSNVIDDTDTDTDDTDDDDKYPTKRRDSLDVVQARGEHAQTTRRYGDRRRVRTLAPVDAVGTVDSVEGDLHHKTASMARVLGTVWPTLGRRHRIEAVAALLLCLVVAACNPIFSYILARLLAAFWAPPGVDKMDVGRPWALALVGLSVVDGAALFGAYLLAERVALAWVTALRTTALARVMRQPRAWWAASDVSYTTVVECLDRGGEEMRKLVSVFVPLVATALAMVALAIVWALAAWWKPTVVVLAVGPVVVAATTVVAARISNTWEHRAANAANAVSAVFADVVSNIRVVRALTLQDYFADTCLARATATAYRTGLQRAWRTGAVYGLGQGTPMWLIALVTYYGATLVAAPADVDTLNQVQNLLLFGIGSGAAMLANVPQIAAAKTVAAQLIAYASLAPDASHEHPAPDAGAQRRLASILPVTADRLLFRYPSSPGRTILRSLSFTVGAGELVGIVGPSGGGKSTVLSLLLRLYTDEVPDANGVVAQSRLAFHGVSCSDLDTAGLRAHMAYVPQQPYLFPATVRHNLAFGLPEDSPLRADHCLEAAARAAGIHDFVLSLPDGYNTVVGGGSNTSENDHTAVAALSGGQAQRICVARALLRHPQLLVMDEPTSALDAASADIVRRAVRALVPARPGMAVVVATHSKAMMRLCDRLLVVQDGVVAAAGHYDALLRQGGVFAQLLGEVDD